MSCAFCGAEAAVDRYCSQCGRARYSFWRRAAKVVAVLAVIGAFALFGLGAMLSSVSDVGTASNPLALPGVSLGVLGLVLGVGALRPTPEPCNSCQTSAPFCPACGSKNTE